MDLDSLLRDQHGVVTHAQAIESGLTVDAIRWRVADGEWLRISRGLYRVRTAPLTWQCRAHALSLKLGPAGALTLETAAHLHGVEGRQPQIITGTVIGRQVERLVGTRVTRCSRLDAVTKQGLPVTSPATTVLDLAARPGTTWRETIHLVARWVHQGLVSVEEIARALDECGRHPQRRVITRALEPVAEGVESVLELQSLRRVVARHGLPMPTLQVRGAGPGKGIRKDAEWEGFGVVLESDGVIAHGGESIHRDRQRDRHVARSGRVTLRAGHVDIEFGACELALDVYLTLRARGCRGGITPCGTSCAAAARPADVAS
ncbi:MAG: type IV toxin-antitoxin system AbiEi family antitoxin domain-containing protein [Intrasporangiaceae bacterium]|nr:type IV toxin-antitoxin system AbiEi family antitoxin domain-containing protein [Intrasporangiaceae bacterium]